VRGRTNYPLLFDREGKPKPSFYAVLREANAGEAGAPVPRAQTPATLTIDLNTSKAAVSPTLYGLMTEEINYSYDGGLYAELIRNRTFRADWTGVLNWFVIEKGTSAAKLSVDSTTGPS
jgi:alpha-L-arabinofuranosidase